MARAGLTFAATALLLAGCGIDVTPLGDPPAPTPSPSASGSDPESEGGGDDGGPGSTPAVRHAVRRQLASGTGRVTTTLTLGPLRVTDEATYDLARGFTIRRQLTSPDGTVEIEGTVVGQDLWYRLLAPQELTCWIHTTPDALQGFTTRTVAWTPASAPRPVVPSGVNVLGAFKGTGEPDSSGNHPGTTRLAMVIELVGAPALRAAGLSRADRTRVDARLRIVDGHVTTLVVDGPAINAGLKEADATLPGGRESTRHAIVSFSQSRSRVSLSPPPPAAVVELGDAGDEFEQDLRDCEQAQP
ncbi:hypothetical protein GCM10009623_08780 [Nocardioides aestuarii]|uniref:LppX_LprAFG lipoprotein n=1 Tax=Nocardioides aestuarii TaxID=252231 RepID=A0ABW4TFC3_9ACTN